MRPARFKLVVGSIGGLALASLLGVGLGHYAESGSFAFYKQAQASASTADGTNDAVSPTATAYAPSYPVYSATPPSRIDALYPASVYMAPEPQPVLDIPPETAPAESRGWKPEPMPSASPSDSINDVAQSRKEDASQADRPEPTGPATQEVTAASVSAVDGN